MDTIVYGCISIAYTSWWYNQHMTEQLGNGGQDNDGAWELSIPDTAPLAPNGVAPGSLDEELAATRVLDMAKQFRAGQVASGETPVSETDRQFMQMTADLQTEQSTGPNLDALRQGIAAKRTENDNK
jgi:hypothetical protein